MTQPAIRPPSTFDESISRLSEIAREKGKDSFRVKVMRRANLSASALESVATLDDATVEHFAIAEAWLVALAGGGPYYVLNAYHESAPNDLVATVVPPVINMPPKPVDPRVLLSPDWRGPGRLVFAMGVERTAPAPEPGRPAPTLVAPLPGVGGPEGRAANAPPSGPSDPGLFFFETLRANQSLSEQRQRAEIDDLRRTIEGQSRQTERSLSSLADTVKAVLQRPVEAAKPALDLPALLTAIGAVVTPVLVKMNEKSTEERRLAAEAENKREEREAKAREAAAAREQMLMEKIAGAGVETAKLMGTMAEAVSQISRVQVQTIASMQELALGSQAPADDGWTGIAKAAIAAFGQYAAISKAGAVTPPALPPAAPTPPLAGAPQGEEQEVAIKDAPPEAVLAEIEKSLREKHEPASDVAEFFVEAMQTNPGVAQAVNGQGGTIPFFQARLGNWIDNPENLAYVQKVLAALQTLVQRKTAAAA